MIEVRCLIVRVEDTSEPIYHTTTDNPDDQTPIDSLKSARFILTTAGPPNAGATLGDLLASKGLHCRLVIED